MSLQTHLHRRGTIYYHRVRVPRDLVERVGRKEISISLKTRDPNVARRRGHHTSVRASGLFEQIRSSKMLSDEQIQSFVVEYYRELLKEDEIWRVENKPVDWKNDREALEYLIQYFGVTSDEEIEAALRERNFTPTEAIQIEYRSMEESLTADALAAYDWGYVDTWVDQFLERKGIKLAQNSQEYGRLLVGFLRARHEAMRVSRHRSDGDWTVEPKDPLFRQANSVIPAPVSTPIEGIKSAAAVPLESPPIIEIFEKFFAEKARSGARPKPLGEMRTSFKWFTDYFGTSKKIEDFSVHDLRNYKDALLKVPTNFSKLLKCDTIKEAIELNESRKLPTLDIATINGKRLGNISSFFAWAEANRYIDQNPAKGIRVVAPKGSQVRKKRDGFSVDQLNAMFRAPIYTGCRSPRDWADPGDLVIRDHRYWLPLVALFTGGRKTELAQLNTDDVHEIRGIWCLVISDLDDDDKHTKNAHSNRTVPVHPELKTIGFLEYAQQRIISGEKKLFDCDPGPRKDYDAFSKWFNRFRISVGIEGKRTVFHSFRHNFEQAMADTDMNESLRLALGGRTDSSSKSVYIKEYKPSQLYNAISKVNYEGLDLSHLYPSENH